MRVRVRVRVRVRDCEALWRKSFGKSHDKHIKYAHVSGEAGEG